MTYFDKKLIEQSGLDYILSQLPILTPFGRIARKEITPFKKEEYEKIIACLDRVTELENAIVEHPNSIEKISSTMENLRDIRGSLKRCKEDVILDEVELFEIKKFSIEIEKFLSIYRDLNLKLKGLDFISHQTVTKILNPDEKILPTFAIYDSYSEKLKALRKKKQDFEKKILSERDQETKNKLLEERLQIVLLEKEEVLNIRKALSQKLKPFAKDMNTNSTLMGVFDLELAKAKIAIKYGATRPKINNQKSTNNTHIHLKEAFHPQVMDILSQKDKAFTPLDLNILNGVTLLTGANMGGKTVALKTITLNILLVQLGFFTFAKECKALSLDFIYFIGGETQDIQRGLSSFGGEVLALKEALNQTKGKQGLLVLDEFARSTNPFEGESFVKALCEYNKEFATFTLMSTHYDVSSITQARHFRVIGLENANFDAIYREIFQGTKRSIELIEKYMDYRIKEVEPGHSLPQDALMIAGLMGVEEPFLQLVKKIYRKEEVNIGSKA